MALAKTLQEDKVLSELKSELSKADLLQYIKKIILFGSRARGDDLPRADYDIAIELDLSLENKNKRWLAIMDKIDELNTLHEIDCVELNDSSEELKKNIFSEGVVIYERD